MFTGTDITFCLSSASNRLPQPLAGGQTGRSAQGRSSRVSQLHLPSLPTRSKHRSQSIPRASRDNPPRKLPVPGRGGGTGRREAGPASRDVPRISGGSNSVNSNTLTTRQSSSARTNTRSTTTFSRGSTDPHVPVCSPVSPRPLSVTCTWTFRVQSCPCSSPNSLKEQPEQLLPE